MSLTFEWDQNKAKANIEKHRISFEDATTVFANRLSITIPDPDHSSSRENREITIGMTLRQRIVVVVHCDRSRSIRIISARLATPAEKRRYEND